VILPHEDLGPHPRLESAPGPGARPITGVTRCTASPPRVPISPTRSAVPVRSPFCVLVRFTCHPLRAPHLAPRAPANGSRTLEPENRPQKKPRRIHLGGRTDSNNGHGNCPASALAGRDPPAQGGDYAPAPLADLQAPGTRLWLQTERGVSPGVRADPRPQGSDRPFDGGRAAGTALLPGHSAWCEFRPPAARPLRYSVSLTQTTTLKTLLSAARLTASPPSCRNGGYGHWKEPRRSNEAPGRTDLLRGLHPLITPLAPDSARNEGRSWIDLAPGRRSTTRGESTPISVPDPAGDKWGADAALAPGVATVGCGIHAGG